MSDENTGAVGYGRPPVSGRFQPGHSGNPAGRKKGTRSISATLTEALSERVWVVENGKRRSITKLEVAFKYIVNKAATGDRHAAKQVIDLLEKAEIREGANTDNLVTAEERRANDLAILTAVRDRVLTNEPEGADEPSA